LVHPFQTKENQGTETLPISDQARDLLGPIDEPTERVFKGLKYSAWHNQITAMGYESGY
jgi:hypothetical protein